MKTMGKVKRTIKSVLMVRMEKLNQDKNVCSVGNLNATDENNGKSEKDSKECCNGSE